MKDLLDKLYAIEKDLTVINESTDPLNEVSSMNISMTGDNADEVAQLVNIMRAGGDVMPRPSMEPKMPPSQDMDMGKALSIMGPPDMGPDMGPDMDSKDDMLKGEKESTDWANSPDEQYMDHNYMNNDLAGGINRSKSQHSPAADGDNPMAVEGGGRDMDCDACDGKGNNAGEECAKCNGSGEAGPGEDDYGNESVDAQIESLKDELYAALKQKQGGDLEEDDIEEGSIKLMHKLHGEGKSHEEIAKQLNMEPSEVKAAMAKTEAEDQPADESDEDATYSIRGKTPEADAELARIAKNAGMSVSEAKDDDSMDEMGCKSKMKKLNASGCSKNEMYKKINAEYGCGKEKFEKLYASSCGSH